MATIPLADAGTLLARALTADAARHGLAVTVTGWRSHPWASATFVGARHVTTLAAIGDAAAWAATLPVAEFTLRGHLVADIVARTVDGVVTIEALTLDSA